MQSFCEQLDAWIDTVGDDVDPAALLVLPEALRSAEEWAWLRWGLGEGYNFEIPPAECREEITELHHRACSCFQKLRAHATLGRFRPAQPSYFYERALMIAMAVGVQHAPKEGGCSQEGTQRRRRHRDPLW